MNGVKLESVVIIEKVPLNEPADWVSRLVCVDKPDESIRVSEIQGILIVQSSENTNHCY